VLLHVFRRDFALSIEGGLRAAFLEGETVMKTASISQNLRSVMLACALAITAVALGTLAFAQDQIMQVNVPFAFHAGSQSMPAGVYRVEIQSSHLILLCGQSRSGFVMTNPETTRNANGPGKVVFNRYGSQYFLSEIWPQGSETGQRSVKSRQEKEAEQGELAENRSDIGSRVLALNHLPR
jgi:hypothetical protein